MPTGYNLRTSGPPAGRTRSGISALLLLLAGGALLSLTSGCAYYNTFYHAKKYYNNAEAAREQAEEANPDLAGSAGADLYRQSIEKSKKVIDKYPGSKWEDDAHLLMAKAYFGRRDFLAARRELDRFPDRFPESNFLTEAIHWRALTAFAQEDYADARGIWQNLLEEYPDCSDSEEAQFYVAETFRAAGEPLEGIDAYRDFLAAHPGGELADRARIEMGSLMLDMSAPEEAAAQFERVANKGKERRQRILAHRYWGEAMESQRDFERALALYTHAALMVDSEIFKGRMSAEEREELWLAEMEAAQKAREDSLEAARFGNNPTDPNARPQDRFKTVPQPNRNLTQRDLSDPDTRLLASLLLREGQVRAKLERPSDALLVFEQVIAEFPRSPYAAEAQYRIGYLYEVDLENFDAAQVAYRQVAQQGRSVFTEDAVRREKNLSTVKSLLAQADGDSLSIAESAAAEARFVRAELYLFQQDKPGKALEEYGAIQEEYPGSDYAAKAALASAWVTTHSLEDSLAGLAQYEAVASLYPGTEYGRRARLVLHGPEPEPLPGDYAGPALDELRDPLNLAALGLDEQPALASADSSAGSATDLVETVTPDDDGDKDPAAAVAATGAGLAAVEAETGTGSGPPISVPEDPADLAATDPPTGTTSGDEGDTGGGGAAAAVGVGAAAVAGAALAEGSGSAAGDIPKPSAETTAPGAPRSITSGGAGAAPGGAAVMVSPQETRLTPAEPQGTQTASPGDPGTAPALGPPRAGTGPSPLSPVAVPGRGQPRPGSRTVSSPGAPGPTTSPEARTPGPAVDPRAVPVPASRKPLRKEPSKPQNKEAEAGKKEGAKSSGKSSGSGKSEKSEPEGKSGKDDPEQETEESP